MPIVWPASSTLFCLLVSSPWRLQHEGHSSTIVGIERRRLGGDPGAEAGGGGTWAHTLLLLDPGERGASLAAALSERQGWQRLVKRGAHTLRCSQYQVLFVERGVAAGAELEQLKRVVAHERF